MKALFIGNSHVVAIKDGLDHTKSPLNDAPTFLIAPGSELDVVVENGLITPRAARTMIVSPEGGEARALPIDAFQAFIMVGLGVSPGQCVRLYRSYRMHPHMEHGKRLLSRGALQAAVKGLLLETPAFKIAAAIRRASKAPIFVVAQPMPPERIMHAELQTKRHQEILERWQVMFAPEIGASLYSVFLAAAIAAAESTGVRFVEQASESRGEVLSRNEYQATLRVNFFRSLPDQENQIEDFSHLNGEYGALMVRNLTKALSEYSI